MEHFNTCNYSLQRISAKTKKFKFIVHLNNTSFNSSCCYSTSTLNREYILNWHQERLLIISLRNWNISIQSFKKFPDRLCSSFIIRILNSLKSRTSNNRSILIKSITLQKFSNFFFNKVDHIRIINHITFVQEYNNLWNIYLLSQKNMFSCLRHWSINS